MAKFKQFPFRKKWKFDLSQQSFFQCLIREDLLKRITSEIDNLKETLSKFNENIGKLKDSSNEFDKIEETLAELDELKEIIKIFSEALSKRKK